MVQPPVSKFGWRLPVELRTAQQAETHVQTKASRLIWNVLSWMLTIFLLIAFTLAGGVKLINNPGMVQEFAQIGLVSCPLNSSDKFAWWGRSPGLRPTPSSACFEHHGRAGPGGPAQTRASAPQDLLHEPLGLGQWFRYFTGILEVSGAIGLLFPSVRLVLAWLRRPQSGREQQFAAEISG